MLKQMPKFYSKSQNVKNQAGLGAEDLTINNFYQIDNIKV